ncbi:MAG: OB-fold domain-containing protein [Patulibacter sp.]|nr:OB-fold domain-containing protein [Patulibacter sp.]
MSEKRQKPEAKAGRHLPLPDVDTEPFWAAAAERRLVCRYDEDGARFYHYPRERAPGTLSDRTSWREVSGRGVVYSYTVVHQAASRAFRDRVPYVLALIDLDEGPRMMATVDAPADAVTIGTRVRVAWRTEEDVTLPIFAVDGGAST